MKIDNTSTGKTVHPKFRQKWNIVPKLNLIDAKNKTIICSYMRTYT